MNGKRRFSPSKRRGMIFHGIILFILAGLIALFYWLAFKQSARGLLFLFLLCGAVLMAPLAGAGYRLYALMNGSYEIDRDGLNIRWGLRVEEMPLPEIEWVRPLDELGETLGKPFLSMPGAYLGSIKSQNLGNIEFMASDLQTAVVVASTHNIVVVSPEIPGEFIRAFQEAAEMGSLAPLDSRSSYPGAFVFQVFKDGLSRGLLIGLVVLTVVLAVMDALLVLGRQTIPLGYAPNGSLLEPVPASYLLLLPVLGLIVFFSDLIAGFFFFPRKNLRLASYAVWIAGCLVMLMLITASLLLYFSAG